jgi:mRNA interferase MazF
MVRRPIRRGQVWLVDLDPARPDEANKRRPCVVVSNDRLNAGVSKLGRGVVTVVPITGNVDTVYTFQVAIAEGVAGLDRPSKAQCEQVRAVAVSRLAKPLGTLDGQPEIMKAIEFALRLHLAL